MRIRNSSSCHSANEDSGDRKTMTEFWAQYASAPTVQTMMLNADAQNWDESDRLDVISGLPDLSGKDVIELGCGIGRFTKYFAEHSRAVYASDFIESFVLKNKELNNHFGNIEFYVVDAVNQDCDENSCDLVFTNWLLMYLTDTEIIQFLMNSLTWIRPGGHLHIRESCTEPSTKAPKKLVKNENPTYYRHASVYMRLLSKMRSIDSKTGQIYGYQLQWAKSIPTYVAVKANWRQVHMILKKVPIETSTTIAPSGEDLLDDIFRANMKQSRKDQKQNLQLQILDDKYSPVDQIVLEKLESLDLKVRGILNLNCSLLNSFTIGKCLDCCVEGLTNDFYTFSAMLGEGNKHADKRIQFQWTNYVTDPWKVAEHTFDALVGINVVSLTTAFGKFLNRLRDCLNFGSSVIFMENTILEPVNGLSTQALKTHGFELVSFENCTDAVKHNTRDMTDKLKAEGSELGKDIAQDWQTWHATHPQWSIYHLKAI